MKTSGGISAEQPAVHEIPQPNNNPTTETTETLQNREVSESAPNPEKTPKTLETMNGETSTSQKQKHTKNSPQPDAVST